MIQVYFLTVLSLIFVNNDKSIENKFIRVETSWHLIEETKKKYIYEVTFQIKNKEGQNVYYIGSKVKNFIKTNESNSFSSEPNEVETGNLKDQGSKVTTAVQKGSSYVDSGGAKSVGDQSSLSGGSSGRTNLTERKPRKLKESSTKLNSYDILTHFFSFNNNNPKNLKFTLFDKNQKTILLRSQSTEKFSFFIPLDNIFELEYDLDNSPIICLIPPEGIAQKSRIEISKRTNQKQSEFNLAFTKDEVYANKIKLLLDKTFHLSLDEAIKKYTDLQKILNESL
tara:strand:+ start:16132 stop:16977 length:846 start_codon:yes stop_codon:yes gene_type:complete